MALQFLTVITIVPELSADRRQLSAALSYFPLVGLVIGAIVAGLNWAVADFWHPFLCGAAAAVLLAILTRGLHLDGLADTADAIGSGASREKALAIMKDSCSGALGVLALCSALILKAASAANISEAGTWQLFMLVPCLSRWSLNCLAASSRYARAEGGLGEAFCGKPARQNVFVSGLTAIAASWFLAGASGLVFLGLATAAGPAAGWWFDKKFGGITGDMLGAHLETVETFLFMLGAGISL